VAIAIELKGVEEAIVSIELIELMGRLYMFEDMGACKGLA
jgi:hypothetical protein